MLVMERQSSTTKKQFGGTAALQALLSADNGFTPLNRLRADDELSICSYVGADPVNFVDPMGTRKVWACDEKGVCGWRDEIVVTGSRCSAADGCRTFEGELPSEPWRPNDDINGDGQPDPDIVVTGRRTPRHPLTHGPLYHAPQGMRLSPAKGPDFCGSKGSEWVPDGAWQQACRSHDQCYAQPGANKEACDARLARDITVECSSRTFLPGICAAIGAFYGGVLSAVGLIPGSPPRNAYNSAQETFQRNRTGGGGW